MHWIIDQDHTNIEFSATFLNLSQVRGRFRSFHGTIDTEIDGSLTAVELAIATASLDTNQALRDSSLRSPSFLDAEGSPTISFRSSFVHAHGDIGTIDGVLTMRGAALPLSLAFTANHGVATDAQGKTRIGAKAEITLDRSQWKVDGNMLLPSGAMAISDQIRVHIDVQAVAGAA